jgi:hypothetical protein
MMIVDEKKSENRAVLSAILLMAVSFVFLFALNFVPGKSSREVAAIFSPHMSAAQIIRLMAPMEVQIQRLGAVDNIVILTLGKSEQIDELYDNGAWLVLDALFSGGCLAAPKTQTLS